MSKTIIGIFSSKEEAHRAAGLMRELPSPGVSVKITQRTAGHNHGSGYGPAAYHSAPMPTAAVSPEGGILPVFYGLDTHQPPSAATAAVEVTCEPILAGRVSQKLRSLGALQIQE